ncbi:putative dynein heavy chain [Leptomonas seymouri]|uniref:Cytoplasmic dynein 2 heavy chain 1 n=1 Tax=Leptomonas seymouri TaxID=5684 RepID=A0A0N1PCM6_LEPSE|nr:putative dynein heavy chain [Leptomonas seymouri]|eukprot:KPI88248.1 putative dynein heavy chain [Leptomonas seymouri]
MNLSPTVKDCVTAVTKVVKKRLSGEIVERKDVGTVIELQIQASLSTTAEAAAALLAAMTRAACGAERGSTKLQNGEITVDAAVPLRVRKFSDCVRVSTFRFQELPADNATVCAIAEAAYTRHLQRSSELTVYGLEDFPPCLLRDALSRFDVSVGGYILLSFIIAKDKSISLRLYTTAMDAVMSSMCSTLFTSGVLPAVWAKRSSLEPHQLLDALEDVQLAVNEYWHDSAQDNHARSVAVFLMSSVGSNICDYFKERITVANGVFLGEKRIVEEAHLCCDEWITICGRLTTIDWASEWGQRYEDALLVCVRNRLRTVLSLRGIVEEVSELLSLEDFRALKTEVLWEVFSDIAVMDSSATVQNQWNTALAAYYRRLEPVEHRCATVLRELFASRATLAPQAILSEFSGYCCLMKRPIIARELVTERDCLLGKLNDRLAAIRLEYEHRAESTEDERVLEEEDRRCQTGRFFPGVVNNIIWLRQLCGRIEEMVEMCSSILNDLPNANAFITSAKQLLEEVQDYEQECFRSWAADVEDKSDVLTLDADAPLMEIDAKGRVEVNYSERLVELLKEVRVLSTLGFHIPHHISRIAQQGKQFLPMGAALKQVAHTYNSMAAEIIPCTRAMLLEPALGFEKVITADGSKKLTWRSAKEAARFIEQLQSAAQSLTECNRRLHKTHQEIEGLVLELFRISLLRSRDRWMRKVRLIREKIELSGFKNTESWREFWDMQLYKAMEAQYQLGLESLHKAIEEIKADIVWDADSGQAALRPSLEALRTQYYQRMHDFITFPQRFRGCSEKSIFKDMPSRNTNGIYAVLQHAAQLFKRVSHELKRFTPYLILGRCGKGGNPTLEQIVGKSLTEVQHWEQSVRLLKQKGKEINNEDLFIKCDCITLCTAAVKGAVEEHLVRLTDALKSTLKESAEQHLTSINDFLAKAATCLDSKLTKLHEIGEANLLYGELMEQRPAMEVEFYHFYNKNVLLQNMTASAGLDFTKTKDRWSTFMTRLDSHEKEVEEQLNRLKNTVGEAVKEWEKDSIRFTTRWHEMKPKDLNSKKPLEFVTKKKAELQTLKERGEECKKQCEYFQMDEPDLQPLEDAETDIEDYFNMWSMLAEFQQQVQDICKEPWVSFRAKLYRFEDFVKVWQEKLKEIPANSVTVHIRTMLDRWGRCVPLLKYVRGDGFTPTHWTELFTLLKLRMVTQDTVNFGHILDRHESILQNEAQIKALHSRAQGEAQIREALDDVRAWGTEARFALTPHPDRPGVVLITDWKDTISALSDNRALLLSMKESPYFSLFSSDANKWEERLSTLDEYMRQMNQIQRKWVYLEPIFRRGALPNEKQRFDRIDSAYLTVMKSVEKDSRLMSLAKHGEFQSTLGDVSEQLERCQKALNEYLESKRDSFPRFYFISDDDLLEILAQSKNPSVIQSHLKKLFMGIHSVQFDAQKENILQVLSLEGEVVTLLKPVRVTEEVESWLSQLDVEVKSTLKAHVAQCVAKSDIGAFASQVLCTAEMVTFTRKVETAIRESSGGNALKKLKASLQVRLRELTAYAGGNSDALVGIKLKALIMDLIHNIAVVDLLITNNVEKESHWLWKKQLRFYLDGTQQCLLRMVDAEFRYTYEYQGNAPKLVHTPLTDRCYLTLTQGMQLGYGGNPYGPAGTGKTESVKALGNAMGRQVLVFNCDEGIDFKSMGRIFTGLVKCGAWGCFDEFNRLKIDQLSAVSQMIQVIQEALKSGEKTCGLLGREINVDPNAGIFVTMNPAGKGYGGRSKLPDNLKQLFRSISMSAPDNELITETILYSEGFENATQLSTKVVETFKLSSQLLSYQQHYDWGLRAMKAVLRLGGILIHDFLMERVAGKVELTAEQTLQKESEIIIKSLRVNTLSKLTFDDAVLFNTLLSDIFPGVPVLEIAYAELRPAIEESMKELKLQVVEAQIQKILQLYEALRQRMGVVLVGPSGSGKSTLMRVLRRAVQRLGKKVPLYVVNPKALPRDQLLGHMDPDTREWFDGVLTDAAKKVVKEEPSVHSWVFCDGDIDPEWIESLNSVLDDNKLLTMPNGVRVQFGDNVNFLFETHSLEHASPATVSRMGIIYLSEEDVDPKVAVAAWLAEQPEEAQVQLKQWIDAYFYKAIDSLLTIGGLVVETTRTGLVMSGLAQLKHCTTKKKFALALIYGLGSYLPEKSRQDYAKDVLFLVEERAPDPRNPLDFKYDEDHHEYVALEFEQAVGLSVEELYRHPMVSTVDCQRALEVMKAWTAPTKPGVYRPFILVGPEGCGKSMLLNNLFSHTSNTRVASVNCSAQTEAVHVIQKLKQTCSMFNSNQGKVLRPKEAERLILLLKDLNLPKPDKYGTVQLHSLLQQLVLYNGFYDSDLEWVTVERVQIVGSMNPPGSMGRNPVAPRFLAITSILAISYPSKEALQQVYSEFLNVMLQSGRLKLNMANKGAADLARVVTTVYETVTMKCTVDVASHYVFNPRDLTQWVLNMLNYDTPNMGDALAYEARRIFVDRLVTVEERTKLSKAVRDNVTFLVGHRDAPPEKESVYYVSWIDSAPAGKKRLMASSLDDVKKSVDAFALKYSRENASLNVQLIPDVCAWITRVDRVLSQERGNLLLVARSGVCAPQIVRLVAYNNRTEVVTLGITRDYGVKQFTTELKAAMIKAGIEGQSVVLLLEDFNFFHPFFLETINSILSSGEVPGLFSQEEQEALLAPLKGDAMGEGMSAYNYFVERIARYLHVVVVMDPTNANYELQCRANPALFTRCNVYWMGTWDSSCLKAVPRIMIADTFKTLDQRADKKEFSLTTELVHIHRSFGEKFSPQHFKVLCETFDHLFQIKGKEVTDGLSRLRSGVTKLDEAQENVDNIATDVTEKKALLEVKQREADDALKEIQKKMEEAGNQKRSIHKIQKSLDKEQTAIQERKEVIEGRLSGIQPVLDAALSAVSSIRSDHLAELRSMAKPPAAVQCVIQGVVLLIDNGKGVEAAPWPAIRKILAGDIKGQILNFDIDNVNSASRVQVEKFIGANENSFKREVIARASKAAAPMAEWLKAVVEYSKVLETVAPMRAELKEYEAHIEKGQIEMLKYEEKLKKVEKKVEELKRKFGEKTTEAERLKDQLEQAEQLLVNAKELLGKLGDEHKRWTEQMKTIKEDSNFLPKRCLLAAAFITYLGQDAEDKRRATLAEWKERVKLPEFNFFSFLRDESVQLHYKAEGLPGDELSLDNAVMLHEQVYTALIADPSGQIVEWLLTNLKKQQAVVDVCNISEERLVSALELALRFGKKFIITDVDRIEPFLYPILRKELHNEGTKRVIQIGDRRTVDYADGFQLYLVTRSTDLRVAPDILSYLTPISFTITHSGLEGQFLGITIQHEQPQLEKEKLEILKKEENLKMQLAELEERLLANLANSEGSLLENKTLIDSLNQIKSQASDISVALDQSKVVQADLDVKRNVYRPFATTASTIFFLTKSLVELSHMYQFSLHTFIDLFQRALHQHKDLRTDPETKIAALQETFIQITVSAISQSLFKEHRVVYGIHLCRNLYPSECSAAEWEFFVDEAIALETKRKEVRVPTFVLPDSVETFRTFAALFPELASKARFQEADVWLQWMRTATPETGYPGFLKSLTHFQRLLLMKTLRGDRLIAAMNVVSCTLLKVDSLGDSSTLVSAVNQSEASRPVLLLINAGADPSLELQAIAYEKIGRMRFHQLAMGSGQTAEAMRLVRDAAAKGEWVFLKNLHLVLPWVSQLQKELTVLKPNASFRLFLTSEAHDEFPSILLGQSLKITFEPPPGIKQNLLRTYRDWGAAFVNGKDEKQRQLLFMAAALQAIVQERRSYVPQGWTKDYEVTAADLKSSAGIVLRQSSQGEVDWRAIRGILNDAIYGGKMETAYDTRIITTYIEKMFSANCVAGAEKQEPLFYHTRIPSGDYADFEKVIKKLPNSDIPVLFSLPPNADRVVQLTRVRTLTNDLQRLNESHSEAAADREAWAARLTPLLDAWAALTASHADILAPPPSALPCSSSTDSAAPKSIERFIAAEQMTALRLVSQVNASLNELRKVIEGGALLTEDRRREAAAMILGDVPANWEGHFPSTARIAAWLQSLVRKTVTIGEWQKTASMGKLMSTSLDLSKFFRAKTFLNALRQETAHVIQQPLVSLTLVSTTSTPLEDAKCVIALEGLLLQGAVLDDADKLEAIATADEPAVFPINKAFVAWVAAPPQLPASVSVPVYANSTKEDYVCDFVLPCANAVAARDFVLSGVSIVLEQ